MGGRSLQAPDASDRRARREAIHCIDATRLRMTTPRIISDDQVDRVKELVTAGYTDEAIGVMYGCSKQNAFNFRKRHDIPRRSAGYRPSKPRTEDSPVCPIRSYFDKVLRHIVHVYAS